MSMNKHYTKSEEQTLLQQAKAFGNRPIQLELDLPVLLAIIGNLQLALRHPANRNESAQVIRSFIREVRKQLKDYPAIQQLIDRGFNPKYDYEPGNDR